MISYLLLSFLYVILFIALIYLLKKIFPENKKETLELPKGFVRTLITFIVITPLPIILLLGIDVPSEYFYVVACVIGFYFGTKIFEIIKRRYE